MPNKDFFTKAKESTLKRYADIIDMPHPEPRSHERMSAYMRAAQFAPFAALTGLDDQMDETAEDVLKKIIDSETGEEWLEDP